MIGARRLKLTYQCKKSKNNIFIALFKISILKNNQMKVNSLFI